MASLRRWDSLEKQYLPYTVPDDWNPKVMHERGEEIVCVSCGKKVNFDDTYTSLEIQTDAGFGYPVCEECYDKEWLRRKEGDLWD